MGSRRIALKSSSANLPSWRGKNEEVKNASNFEELKHKNANTYRRALIIGLDVDNNLRDRLAPGNLHKGLDPPFQRICWQVVVGDSEWIVHPGVLADFSGVVLQGLDPAGKPTEGQISSG
jgi:hypothetical protein